MSSPLDSLRCPHCTSAFDLDETTVLAPPQSSDPDATQVFESDATLVFETNVLNGPSLQTGRPESASFGAPAESYGAIVPGSILGSRYEILRMLGEGGMGTVFEARDREVDRVVALKVIRPELASNDHILGMFKRELVLARQVTHRNVIRIYDLGLVNSLRFITMQYVDGRDLHSLLEEKGKYAPEEAAAIIVQVCEGLAAAHEQNVIHRDLKPHNIMIDGQGGALVMDFGLAHSTETGGAGGTLFGTPQYMSPEQANREELDVRSDLFTIGIIFYELLTGSLPFEAKNLRDTLARRIKGVAQPPIEREPSIPKALNDIVMKCLAKKREDRYQTAAEIAYDLQVWQGVIVPPSKLWKRVSLGFAVLLLIAGGLEIRAYLQRPQAAPKPVTVLVADFRNQTGEHVLDGTLEPLFTEAIEGASFISAYPRARARTVAGQVKEGVTSLDNDVARLVALREGVNVVLAGSIVKNRSGYQASMKALDAATGKVLVESTTNAASKEKLAGTLADLARPVRKALGDHAPAAGNIEAGETFTAASLAAAQEYSLAQADQSAGKYKEAIGHYQKAVDLDPNNGRAYSGMGVSYRNLDNREEAEKFLKVAMAKSGQMSERERYRTRGAYYVTIKDYEKAADEYKTLIGKFPADNVGLGNLALCYTYLRNMPKVIENLQKVIAIYPKDARQRMNLAEGYLYGGKFQDSAREADEVLKLSPAFERAFVAKAVAALADGHPDQAAAFYEEAGKVGQRYRAIGLADLDLYTGQPADAVALLEKGIQADLAVDRPEWAVLKLIALGHSRLLLGQRAGAITAAKDALARTKDETAKFLAARILIESGEYSKAESVAQDLSKELYNEPLAYGKLLEGEVAMKKGQQRDAIRLMLDARALVDTWIGHYDLGRAYLAAEAWPEADSEFDACINRRGEAVALDLNLDPTFSYFPEAYYYSGRAKQGIGSPAAKDAFQTYLTLKAKAENDPLIADAKKRLGN
ncbi:MAG TPA: protein kinase [Bryobacteraceae bacterium]|nr:protein kinase [Bryobacteraceae bacterium]